MPSADTVSASIATGYAPDVRWLNRLV